MFTLPGKAIANIFSPPKPKLPERPPPLPSRDDEAIQARKREEKLARQKRAGIGSSILTSGLGVTTEANVTKPQLLGQV